MKRHDWCKPLNAAPRSVDELIADLIEGATALAAMAERWNPEAITAADTGAASATLLGLTRSLGELRRARHGR